MTTGGTGTIKRAVRSWRPARIGVVGSLVAAGLLFAGAQAASANWLELDTPNVSGATTWEFTAVSCTSPSICMAVGDSSDGTSRLLAENRTKAGWTIQPIPQPAAGSALLSVWCTFSFSCTAVGDAPHGSNGTVPLAEHWNGTKWRIQTTPAPKGAANSQFSDVACASALDCVAVGFASASVNSEVPLVERWNGTSWKIEKAPTRSGFTESTLNGVSCTSATRCIAVGGSFKPSKFVTLAEIWNGSKWTIQATPNTTSGGSLNAIHCLTRTDCMAVGDGLGARWNGGKWSLVKLGFPGTPADLTSISCLKTGVCYADGGFFSEAVLTGVIEFWNGSRWRVQNPNISASNDSNVFNGMSCTTATNCTAVGSFHDGSNRALAEDFSLRWQNVSPQPFFGAVATGMNAVSCVSPNACLAVGTVESTTGSGSVFETFSETWDGTSWGNSKLPPKPTISNLDAVSCRSASFCIAVGDILSGDTPVPLAERWNGTGWSIQKTPNPSGANRAFLTSVSCPATNACTAVGIYNRGSSQLTLAEHWNGKTWKIQHTPNPAGKSLTALNGVSCVSASACAAAGTTSTGMFAERWDGKSWKIHATPLPKGGKSGFLNGVSCTSARACLAVGDFVHSRHLVPLAEFWNGKSWKGQQAATPGGATTSGLSGVSCASASACGAVGFKSGTANNAFAEHWTGKRWIAQPIDLPPGSQFTLLAGVSCNSAIACMAVGSFDDNMAIEQRLYEQYS